MHNLEHILKELIEADPQLAEHKEHLRQLLAELIKHKPDVTFDEEFKARLREAVWTQIDSAQSPKFSMTGLMPKLVFALGGALVMAMMLVPFMIGGGENLDEMKPVIIKSVGEIAFGDLSDTDIAIQQLNAEVGGGGKEEGGLGAGGSGLDIIDSGCADGGCGGGGDFSSDFYYSYPVYNYTYVGDEFSYEQGDVAVLKRIYDDSVARLVGNIFGKPDLGLIDLGNFEDLNVDFLSMSARDDVGYSVFVDLNYGEISVTYNDPAFWEVWEPATAADMLPEQEILNISNSFISELDISLEGYGEPEVQDLDISEVDGYYPDYATVIYPLLLDDQNVYMDWGWKSGISVSVDLKNKIAYSVSGLTFYSFESSEYASISYEDVIKYAEHGGSGGWVYAYDPYYGEETEEIEVQLGNPSLAYTTTWKYEDYDSYQIYVPALIFPVVNDVPDFYQDYVIVPLVSELMPIYDAEYPVIEPYVEEVVGSR